MTPDGSVKLLDFGIAKLLDAEQPGEQTRTGLRRLLAALYQKWGKPGGAASFARP